MFLVGDHEAEAWVPMKGKTNYQFPSLVPLEPQEISLG